MLFLAMNELKVAASSLRDCDAADCGRDTAERAVAALEGGPADALVIFSSPRTDLAALNAGVRAAAPSALLVGCTTAGEIGPHGRGEEGVVVGALRFPGHRLHAAVVPEISRDTRRAGARLAANAVGGAQPARGTLMLFADGLSCDGMALIDGLYDGVGPGVQVIGGFAGDDWQFKRTAQFCGGEVFSDAAVALFLDGVELGLSAKHGFRATGEPRLATGASTASGCSKSTTSRRFAPISNSSACRTTPPTWRCSRSAVSRPARSRWGSPSWTPSTWCAVTCTSSPTAPSSSTRASPSTPSCAS